MHNARAREIYTHIHTEEEEVRRNIRDGKQRLCTYERASTCVLVVCLRECARARWESHLKPSRLCQRYMGPKCERSCTRVSSQGERDEDAPPAQVDLRGQDRGFREFQA